MRESRLSGSVEGVMSNHDSYSDSLVALYCLSSDSQHNPRLRSGAGRSIVTTKCPADNLPGKNIQYHCEINKLAG